MLNLKPWSLIAALGLAATPALAAPGFEVGEWRHRTKMVSADVPGVPEGLIKLVAGNGSRTSCATPTTRPQDLMTGDEKAVCKLRKLSMSNGKLTFDTFCTNDRFPEGLRVLSLGTYTPSSYDIRSTATGKRKGKPVKIVTTGSGKHVANACAKT